MFRTLSCILAASLLSGCGFLSGIMPGGGESSPTPAVSAVRPAMSSTSVSPKARRCMEEVGRLCADPIGCGNAEKAADLLDEAVSADPLDASAYMMRGRVLSELRYHEEAFNDVTKAIRMRPSAEAYAVRGLVCLRHGRSEGARRDFEYAERMDPKDPMVYAYRAAGEFLEGRKGEGCDDLRKACSLGFCLSLESAKSEGLCR